jgi:hypothetical protein
MYGLYEQAGSPGFVLGRVDSSRDQYEQDIRGNGFVNRRRHQKNNKASEGEARQQLWWPSFVS